MIWQAYERGDRIMFFEKYCLVFGYAYSQN
jgi:hypothetical protein